MPLVSEHYWIEDAESGAASALDIDHTVPAGQRPVLQYLYGEASDGSQVAWSLERPDGTVVLQGFTPVYLDFGIDGFNVPGDPGDDVQLHFDAGGSGVTVRGWIIGVDETQRA